MIKAARPDLRKVVKVPEVSRPRVSAAGPFPAVALATTRTPASVVRVPLLCRASIWSAALCPSGFFMVFCSACGLSSQVKPSQSFNVKPSQAAHRDKLPSMHFTY